MFLGFPGGLAGKESACSVRDLGLIPELGRSPGERNGSPLQYCGLENSMDYSHLLKNFPQFIVIHSVKGFSVVNKAEVGVFLELSCFFYAPTDVVNLISGSSAFSKSSLNIWRFLVHVLLKPVLENLFVSALFLVAASRGYTSVALSRPLIVVASLVTQHGL